MLFSLGLKKYLLEQLMVSVGESEGHSPDMDLRGDYFLLVCGDGCILRTHGVLGNGMVYAFN